jgi:broad specificity phosphatase PhoE
MLEARRFIFLRHGQTEWNRLGRIQGHTDIPLNDTGREQAQAAARRLASEPIDRVVSSPLARALDTARVAAAHLQRPLHIDGALKERAFGRFEGGMIDDLKRQHGIPLEQPLSTILPPDAEAWDRTRERARAVVADWLARHPGETLLFVSHDGLFRALHEQLLGTRPAATNATPYVFDPADGRWSVTALVPHAI